MNAWRLHILFTCCVTIQVVKALGVKPLRLLPKDVNKRTHRSTSRIHTFVCIGTYINSCTTFIYEWIMNNSKPHVSIHSEYAYAFRSQIVSFSVPFNMRDADRWSRPTHGGVWVGVAPGDLNFRLSSQGIENVSQVQPPQRGDSQQRWMDIPREVSLGPWVAMVTSGSVNCYRLVPVVQLTMVIPPAAYPRTHNSHVRFLRRKYERV